MNEPETHDARAGDERVGSRALLGSAASPSQAESEAHAWEATLDRIARAVVVLRVSSPRVV